MEDDGSRSRPIAEDPVQITLRLEGSRAERGVSLSDFEGFIDHFLAALRDFDRDRRGVPTRKSGHPEPRATAVTSFRLVRFAPGSGIATIEPDARRASNGDGVLFEEESLSLANLRDLLTAVDRESALPAPVVDDLGKARRAFGDDGSVAIEWPGSDLPRAVVVDAQKLDRISQRVMRDEEPAVSSISGHLHRLDVEPDKLAIRVSSGVDWVCDYPERLEPQVIALVGSVVWATGSGRKVSPKQGTMKIDEIKAVGAHQQSSMFTLETVDDEALMADQGIREPQGLAAVSDMEWDPDIDDAYIAALTDS